MLASNFQIKIKLYFLKFLKIDIISKLFNQNKMIELFYFNENKKILLNF